MALLNTFEGNIGWCRLKANPFFMAYIITGRLPYTLFDICGGSPVRNYSGTLAFAIYLLIKVNTNFSSQVVNPTYAFCMKAIIDLKGSCWLTLGKKSETFQ